jgi:SAM-dependent methyltransferase
MTVRDDRQRAHYDAIIDAYEAHYDDALSRRYRHEFVWGPLFAGLPLRGLRVLEAMCGSGQATGYLLERGAIVTGLDIAPRAVARFRERWPSCDAVCASVLTPTLPPASFDVVVVAGGLHHLHPDVAEAIAVIHRLLVPGAAFCFFEPHQGSAPDVARRLWYRRDPLFLANEASIDVAALRRRFASDFVVEHELYGGGPAYLAVLNSMVLRVSHRAKHSYGPALLALERITQRLATRRLSCFVLGHWRKR